MMISENKVRNVSLFPRLGSESARQSLSRGAVHQRRTCARTQGCEGTSYRRRPSFSCLQTLWLGNERPTVESTATCNVG